MNNRIACLIGASALALSSWAAAAPSKKSAPSKPPGGEQHRKAASRATDPHQDLARFEQQTFPQPLPIPSLLAASDAARLAAPARPPAPALEVSPGSDPAPTTKLGAPPPWAARLTLPDLPLRWHSKVLKYLEFYRSNRRGRAIMRTWIKAMGRFAPSIERALAKSRAPRALIYVAMIESGFQPERTSRAGATGLWQFMARTGRGFGLQRTHWIDLRRDPHLSTQAAIHYLLSLYRRFHSWDLALAAYNAGSGTVLNAIRKYNTNDYWRLCEYEAGLPWSTTLYVAKVLAAAIVGENPAHFGYGDVKSDAPFAFDLVSASRSLSLAQIARASGASVDEIKRLNPELRRGRTPPRQRSWIRIPTGSKERFYAQLGKLGKLRYRPYTVALGESMSAVARRNGISISALRRINGLRSEREIHPGLVLLVPARATARAKERSPLQEPELVALPPSAPSEQRGRKRVFYRVVLGDNLADVGSRLGVSADDLARWNDVDPSVRLVSRMVLQAFVTPDQDLSKVRLLDPRDIKIVVTGSREFLELHESRRGRRRVTYSARKGDTLRRLSRRFKLSVGSLARINGFSRRHKLRAGEKVILYLEAKRARKRKRQRSRAKAPIRKKSKKSATKKPSAKAPAAKTARTKAQKKAATPLKKQPPKKAATPLKKQAPKKAATPRKKRKRPSP